LQCKGGTVAAASSGGRRSRTIRPTLSSRSDMSRPLWPTV